MSLNPDKDMWMLFDDRGGRQKVLFTGTLQEILAEFRKEVKDSSLVPKASEVESQGYWFYTRLSIMKHPDYTDSAKQK